MLKAFETIDHLLFIDDNTATVMLAKHCNKTMMNDLLHMAINKGKVIRAFKLYRRQKIFDFDPFTIQVIWIL